MSIKSIVDPADEPGILDAVIDQNGIRWIKFGTPSGSCWFSYGELMRDEKSVFAMLAEAGVPCAASRRKTAIKDAIDEHKSFREGFVAAHSGWVGPHFVMGDGGVISPEHDRREVIITFATKPKFSPTGSLAEWQIGMSILKDQPIGLFLLAYAFVPPLLKLAPPNFLNPQLEITGIPECGKTSLAIAATSVWAGDRESEVGGGQTWDVTALYLDRAKADHSGGLLFLDEGNLAGADQSDQREVVRRAVFSLSSRGARRRQTDVDPMPNVHVGTLSTSNKPLRDLIGVPGAMRDALQSRMPTIEVDPKRPFGVFEFIPKGFTSSRAAIEALRSIAFDNYAVAARPFVEQLVAATATDEPALRARIAKLMKKFRRKFGEVNGVGQNRVLDMFALTFAAGILAREWGILPRSLGRLGPAFIRVLSAIQPPKPPQSAMDRIHAYVAEQVKNRSGVPTSRFPLTKEQFEIRAGFLNRDGSELLVPTTMFKSAFPDHAALLKQLKAGGHLRGEGGNKPKLSVKTPKAICPVGRVYRIRLASK